MIFDLLDLACIGMYYIGIYLLAGVSDPISIPSLLCLLTAYALFYIVRLITESSICFLLDPKERDTHLKQIVKDEGLDEEDDTEGKED